MKPKPYPSDLTDLHRRSSNLASSETNSARPRKIGLRPIVDAILPEPKRLHLAGFTA